MGVFVHRTRAINCRGFNSKNIVLALTVSTNGYIIIHWWFLWLSKNPRNSFCFSRQMFFSTLTWLYKVKDLAKSFPCVPAALAVVLKNSQLWSWKPCSKMRTIPCFCAYKNGGTATPFMNWCNFEAILKLLLPSI